MTQTGFRVRTPFRALRHQIRDLFVSSPTTTTTTISSSPRKQKESFDSSLSLTTMLTEFQLLYILQYLSTADLAHFLLPVNTKISTSLHHFIEKHALTLHIMHPMIKIGVILQDKSLANQFITCVFGNSNNAKYVPNIDSSIPDSYVYETVIPLCYKGNTAKKYNQKVTFVLDFLGACAKGYDGLILVDLYHRDVKYGEYMARCDNITDMHNFVVVTANTLSSPTLPPPDPAWNKVVDSLLSIRRFSTNEMDMCLKDLYQHSTIPRDIIYCAEHLKYAVEANQTIRPTVYDQLTKLCDINEHYGAYTQALARDLQNTVCYSACETEQAIDVMQVFRLLGWHIMNKEMKLVLVQRWFNEVIFDEEVTDKHVIFDSKKLEHKDLEHQRLLNGWIVQFKKACPLTLLCNERICVTDSRLTIWDTSTKRQHRLIGEETEYTKGDAYITMIYWSATADTVAHVDKFRLLAFHFDPYDTVLHTSIDPQSLSINPSQTLITRIKSWM
jgi:hypothetical protein